MTRSLSPLILVGALAVVACGTDPEPRTEPTPLMPGAVVTVRDTSMPVGLRALGTADAVARSVLSTRLMGTVREVLVREGDRVGSGQPLLRLDAGDLQARRAQVVAGIAAAEAVQQDAERQVLRMRTLFADSAAPRVMLEAAETGLARARSAVETARAGLVEVDALAAYGVVTAPFAGTIVARFVDPGALAAPGVSLLTIEDDSRLRIRVTASPGAVAGIARGRRVAAEIEGQPVEAVVEGIVPATGNLMSVNAVVPNPSRAFRAGSAAALILAAGGAPQTMLLVPVSAVVREGDLTGVRLVTPAGAQLRWVRLGRTVGVEVEVVAGVSAGDQVLLPEAFR